jgi:hypothetical protein
MTIGELKQNLNGFDEELIIGGYGYFGEILEISKPWLCNEGFVVLDTESAGEEPS